VIVIPSSSGSYSVRQPRHGPVVQVQDQKAVDLLDGLADSLRRFLVQEVGEHRLLIWVVQGPVLVVIAQEMP